MKDTLPIVIIEDDDDDKDFYERAFRELGMQNPIRHFPRCDPAMEYLAITEECPFLIISDINLPGMSGLEMRKQIAANPYLKRKSIPFVFLSTSAKQQDVNQAYESSVQGYFQKPSNYQDMKSIIRLITEYWSVCLHPNDNLGS